MSNLMDKGQSMAEEKASTGKSTKEKGKKTGEEPTRENRLQALEKKVDRLQKTVEAALDTVPTEEDLEAIMSLRKEVQKLRKARTEQDSKAEEMFSEIMERMSKGVRVQGIGEIKHLRKKIARFLTVVEKARSEEDHLDRLMKRLSRMSRRLKKKIKKHERTMESAARATERGAWASQKIPWVATGSAAVGGIVGVLMLAGLMMAGVPTLPRDARMTETEIERVRQDKYRDRLKQEMTSEEWNQYRKLLKEVGSRMSQESRD